MQQIKGTTGDLSYEVTSETIETGDALWTRVAVHFVEEYDSHGAEKRGDGEAAPKFYAAVLGALARHSAAASPAEGTHRIEDVIREMLDELVENGHL